jgi:hypothetical protein
MNRRGRLIAAGGGALTALALLGGAAMAQTPGGSPSPAPSASPGASAAPTTPGTPANPGTPGASPNPTAPGGRTDGDCPDKGTGQGTGTTQGMRGMSRARTGGQAAPSALQ